MDSSSPLLDLHDFVTTMQRVQNFEHRHERSRFFLALGAFGILALFAGWIEFLSHHELEIDASQIFFLQSSEYSFTEYPWLVLSTWLIHIAPFAIVIVFFLRYQASIEWKTFYRRTGILWSLSMGLAFIMNGFLATSDISLVVYIWTGAVTFAAFLTPFIIPKNLELMNLRLYFWPLAAISLICFSITLLVEETLRMGVYTSLLGICLLVVSLGLTYFDQYTYRDQFEQID